MSGFFQLQRQIMGHWTYKNIFSRSLWIHMLLSARYSEEAHTEEYNGHLITLNLGEFVFGRDRWAKELEIPEQRMRTLMKKFVDTDMIELRYNYPKGSVYIIKNYQKFNQRTNQQLTSRPQKINQQTNQQTNQQEPLEPQGIEGVANQQTNQLTNQQLTSRQSETNHKRINKELNKEKKEKELKHTVAYADIVDYLNMRASTSYKSSTKKTHDLIKARYNEGFTLEDFKTVIDKKCVEWVGSNMGMYLRPETLFGNKFESYLNQSSTSLSKPSGNYSAKTKKEDQFDIFKDYAQQRFEEASREDEENGIGSAPNQNQTRLS